MPFYQVGNNVQINGLSEIYQKYLGEKTNGTFVEIGAYDGYEWSNTWGLMQLGWSGVEVEPNPIMFQQLVSNCASNVICYNLAIGKSSICKLHLSGAISTTSEEQVNIYKECDWFTGYEQIIEIPMITLDQLLEDAKIINSGFDVLVIDTEGTELEVLETFDIEKWKPKLCLIEAHELHPTKGFNRNAQKINEYFEEHNYKKIYCDIINNIYVRN
jgi:FkbM family methyltransferase